VSLAVANQQPVATAQETGSLNRYETRKVGRLEITEAVTLRSMLKFIKLQHGILMDMLPLIH